MDSPSMTQLKTLFKQQYRYAVSGAAAKEGSPAIALGRAAGLAALIGEPESARQLWEQHYPPATMPGFDDFYRGYQQHEAAFADFANPSHFPAAGTAFSNACGSYAFALDYLSRGQAAVANGGEPQWVCHWGAQALRAAGFPQQAALMETAWQPQPNITAAQPQGVTQTPTPTPDR